MSEIVLTGQATPTGIGANMAAVFYTTANQLAYVDAVGVVHAIPASDANGALTANTVALSGNLTVAGNFTANGRINVSSNISAVVGNVTINAASGRVNAQTATTSLVVTNNFVTANSVCWALAAANDSTGRVTAVEATAGNLTIHYAAPTANMPINFGVLNG